MKRLVDIASRLKGYQLVTDGNIVDARDENGKNLCRLLKGGDPQNLPLINSSLTGRILNHFNEVSYFLSTSSPVIIPEVALELTYLGKRLTELHEIYAHSLNRLKRINPTVNGVHDAGLVNLDHLGKRSSFFANQVDLYTEDVNWNDSYLRAILDVARLRAGDINRKTELDHKGSCLGLSIETDLKLVAYTLNTSMEGPTVLFTKDLGVIELLYRMRSLFRRDGPFPRNMFPLKDILAYDIAHERFHSFIGNS